MPLRSALAAAGPIRRSMGWGPLAGAAVGVAVLISVQRPWQDRPLTLDMARAAALLGTVAAVFTMDDPAAVTLAPSPTTRRWRHAVRVAWALGATAALLSAFLVVARATGDHRLPVERLALETAGMALLGLAFGTALGGDRGAVVVTGCLVGCYMVQQRWPQWALFPSGPGAPGWSGAGVAWAAATAASAAALVLLTRSP